MLYQIVSTKIRYSRPRTELNKIQKAQTESDRTPKPRIQVLCCEVSIRGRTRGRLSHEEPRVIIASEKQEKGNVPAKLVGGDARGWERAPCRVCEGLEKRAWHVAWVMVACIRRMRL
jgi:hypothetical protein